MIERPCLVDGRQYDFGELPEGLFVVQRIRTIGIEPQHTERHFEVLDTASRKVLGFAAEGDAASLHSSIKGMLAGNGYRSDSFSFVTVRQYLSGQLTVTANPIFPYSERGLRFVYPRAAVADYEIPFSDLPSSLTEAAAEAALVREQRRNSRIQVVLRRNGEGLLLSAGDAPLFIIERDTVTTPHTAVPAAETLAVAEAAARTGLAFAFGDIDTDRLLAAEEAFIADHRGLTALSSCGEHTFIHMRAAALGRIF